MIKLLSGIVILTVIGGLGIVFFHYESSSTSENPSTQISKQPTQSTSQEPLKVIATGLDTPWAIVFLPDQSMLITERPGRLRYISPEGQLQDSPLPLPMKDIIEYGEGGLLGMTLHPNFASNHYIYFYYTYKNNPNGNVMNRVVRLTYDNKTLSDEKIIVDAIPGSSNHDGGRIKFGPDGYLYITAGDAEVPSQAQNTKTLGGKILRVTDEGKAAPGNPFNNLVYSDGHRNPQGLAWNANGQLYATEHGRSGITTGYDEINHIQAGKNYGWPVIQGNETKSGMVTPILNSGPTTTWAPTDAVFIGDSLFFGGLKGQALYEAVIKGDTATLKEHFKNQFGRIREVVLGPDNNLYISTSNKDSRGNPSLDDDKIIRVDPKSF